MSKSCRRWVIVLLVLMLPLVALKLISFTGTAPERPAVVTALPGCPASPNCVSSMDTDPTHAVAPLPAREDAAAALAALEEVMAGLGGVKVRENGSYRHFTFRSRWMGYVDDVELLANPEQNRIEVRSASRSGYGDFGVNRRRVEAIRQAYEARR
ncbi:MAG TPA: DUF1499 domain-containing protein, partial [Verrucomicrobiales bacterium]|nr:DUF1499 domain-containing protein [Verrucomicrobiales bacterium]